MKQLIIFGLTILLSGCGYEHTDPELIRNTAPGANLPGALRIANNTMIGAAVGTGQIKSMFA